MKKKNMKQVHDITKAIKDYHSGNILEFFLAISRSKISKRMLVRTLNNMIR